MAKANCKFSIEINGKEIRFDSDRELDLYLHNNQEELLKLAKVNKNNLKKIFSQDPRELTRVTLEDIKSKVKDAQVEITINEDDPLDVEKINIIPRSKGITALIKYLNWVSPFDLKAWREGKIADYITSGSAESEAIKKVSDEEASWKDLTDIGSEIHDYIDAKVQNMEFKPKKLNEEHLKILDLQFSNFIDQIKSDLNDDNPLIYSEFAIKSAYLNKDKETILDQDNIDSINGRIDFLVIDKLGKIHIYDWKISPRHVGNWRETKNDIIRYVEAESETKLYPSTKKLSINYQMAAYAAMFKQYGLTVGSVNVVPINITLDRAEGDFTITNLSDIQIEKTVRINEHALRGKVANAVSEYLGLKFDYANVPKSLDKTGKKLSQLFPTKNVNFKIQQFEADKEFYLNKKNFKQLVPESDKQNFGMYKYRFRTTGLVNEKWIYCKDDNDFDLKVDSYVAALAEAKARELIILGQNIKLALDEKITLTDIGAHLNADQNAYLSEQLEKYIVNNWEFIQDDDLNNAGFFIFKKNEKFEIIMVTNENLFTEYNLGRSASILGQYIETKDWKRREVLNASNGNLEMFKALAYVSENPDVFEGTQIISIRALNPWHGNSVQATNEQLLNNWRQLMGLSKTPDTLNTTLFVDDTTAALIEAQNIIEASDINVEGVYFTTDLTKVDDALEKISSMISVFISKYPQLSNWDNLKLSDPAWQVYNQLLKAQRSLMGYKTHIELDTGNWFNGNIFNLTGLRVTSVQTSPSANMQELGDITNDYSNEVAKRFNDTTHPVRMALAKFYKEAGQLKAIGGEASYFLSWFDDLETLTLKDPESSDFNGQPAARAALTEVLEALAKIRWRTSAEIAYAKEQGWYYQLPLMEAKFNRHIKRLGIKSAVQHSVTKHTNLYEGTFGLKEENEEKQLFERTSHSVYNRFDITQNKREKLLEEFGGGFFETDIEKVFAEVVMSYSKQSVSRKFLPIIMGMKLSLAFQDEIDGNKLTHTRKAFDDYVKKKIYGDPIVEEKLQPLFSYLNLIKSGFSKLSLGLNTRSFGREFLQGTWTGLSRASVERIPGLDFKHYTEAYQWVVQHAKDNVEVAGLARQLGATYRMANMSLNEMVNQSRINWLGIKNWNEDTLFLTSTTPDFLHRTIILVAKMMADGSLAAHSLNPETGKLEYDWSKDKRFEIYVSGDTTHKDYLYQKTLYLKNLEEWNAKGYDIKEGESLPRAYTVREARTFKNWGDLLFGYYDTETRALINDSFLGSLFMQYRTFITAKLSQWLIAPGSYNMDRLEQQYDEATGEEIWEVAVYTNDDLTGIPSRKFVKKSEVTQAEMDGGFAKPYIAWQGDPLEGMAHGMWKFVKAIATLDQEQLNKLWNDPFERKNLYLGLHDLIVMSILALIIQALFGKNTVEDMKNQAWITQWAYAVALGSTQDGPIHNVLSSMFSDLNPPMYGSIQRMTNSLWGVINGDDNLGYAITQNVGAVRELQNFVIVK